MSKVCPQCGVKKKKEEFYSRPKYRDGLSSYCKNCDRTYRKLHYKKNKKMYLKKSINNRKKTREWFVDYMMDKECTECGESHKACLDFHHVDPEEKELNVSDALLYSVSKVEKEIEKCIILCSNCHRKLHYEENN
jgi:hypothetical protein